MKDSEGFSVEWVKVFAGIDNAPVVAAALASLGLSPKVTRSAGPRSGFDVLVSADQAPEAIRFLGRMQGTTWTNAEPRTLGTLMAWYCPHTERSTA